MEVVVEEEKLEKCWNTQPVRTRVLQQSTRANQDLPTTCRASLRLQLELGQFQIEIVRTTFFHTDKSFIDILRSSVDKEMR